VKKLLAPVAALTMVLATAGLALAWVQPSLAPKCAPDENSYAWTINLHQEGNFSVDWSFQSNFAGFATVDFGSAGDHDFTTVRGGSTLYVRWSSDHASKAQANADADLCEQPIDEESVAESVAESVQESVAASVAESAGQSAEQSVEAGTGTPVASIPDSSVSGNGSSPLPTVIFSMLLVASLGSLAYSNVRVAKRPTEKR
jgi:hypothetical protein